MSQAYCDQSKDISRASGAKLERRFRTSAKYKIAGVALAAGFMTSGCSATVIGALSFADMSTGLSLVSMAFTGKGLGEHAMDVVTGKDCRFIEGVFREDREVCEERESVATKDDFKGVVAWLSIDDEEKPAEDAAPTAVAEVEASTSTGLSAGATAPDITVTELAEIAPASGSETISLHSQPVPTAPAEKEWTVEELAQAALPRLRKMDEGREDLAKLDEAPVQQDLPFEPDQADLAALASIAPAAGTPDTRLNETKADKGIEMTMLGTPVAPSALDLPQVRALF